MAAIAAVLLTSHGGGVVAQAAVNRTGQPDKAKLQYGHCADVGLGGCETGHFAKTGKGFAVCETYLKHLNLLKEIPTCEAPIPLGFSQPVWEELDISSHLQLAYQAEAIKFIGRGGGYKQPDFETWRQHLLSEMQTGKVAPQLRKTTVRPFGDKSITLLAYTRDQAGCKTVAMHHDSWWAEPGYVHFLLTDDPQNSLRAIHDRVSRWQFELLLFGGKPYFVATDRYYPSFEIIAFDFEVTNTAAYVAALDAYEASARPDPKVDMAKRNLAPDPNVYWAGQLCHFLPVKPSKR